jgi:hypothetical protein
MKPASPTFTEFVDRLTRVNLTPGQRALCEVAFDGLDPGDLPDERRAIANELYGHLATVPERARAVAGFVIGARSGKSRLLIALRCLHLGMTVALSGLAPGEQAFGVIVAPDLRLAQQTFRFVAGAVDENAELRRLVVGRTNDAVTLRRPDGAPVTIACVPAAEAGKSLRGRSLFFAGFDESAFFYSDDYSVSDSDLFRAVRPRIVPGGQTVIASTPWAEQGLLYELWRDNFGKASTALVAHAPTLSMRDDAATQQVVEAEYERDPQNAAREFGAQWGSNDQNLLDTADVDGCVDDIDSRPVERGKRYAIGLDLGVRNDSTAVVRVNREMRRRDNAPPAELYVVGGVLEYRPKLFAGGKVDLDRVEQDVAREAKAASAAVHHDIYLSDSFAPRLAKRGVKTVEISMSSAEQARRAALLAALVRDRRLRLVRHPELIRQLKQLRLTRHAGGRISVAVPQGRKRHDDLADALMLAIDGARELPATGGDIYRRMPLWCNFGADGVVRSPDAGWFERLPDGSERRVTPPMGTPEHEQARRDRFVQGIYTPADVDELGEEEVARRLGINRSVM